MLPELNMSQTINPLSCTVSIHSGTHENLLYDKDPHVFKQFSFPRSASWEMSADRLTDNKSTKSDGASWLTRGTEFLPLSHVRPVKTAWCGGRCIPLTLSLQQAFIYFRTQLQYPHHTHTPTHRIPDDFVFPDILIVFVLSALLNSVWASQTRDVTTGPTGFTNVWPKRVWTLAGFFRNVWFTL